MDIKEIRHAAVHVTNFVNDREKRWGFINTAMKLRVF